MALVVSLSTLADAQPADVIGGLEWGATRTDALQALGVPTGTGGTSGAGTTYFEYRTREVSGHVGTLLLLFDDAEGLFGAMFLLPGYRQTREDFEAIDEELRRLHGEPTRGEVRRRRSATEDNYTWKDIADGDVTLFSAWDADETTILHTAYSDEGQAGGISHQLFYVDPAVMSAEEAYRNRF